MMWLILSIVLILYLNYPLSIWVPPHAGACDQTLSSRSVSVKGIANWEQSIPCQVHDVTQHTLTCLSSSHSFYMSIHSGVTKLCLSQRHSQLRAACSTANPKTCCGAVTAVRYDLWVCHNSHFLCFSSMSTLFSMSRKYFSSDIFHWYSRSSWTSPKFMTLQGPPLLGEGGGRFSIPWLY
jgi:hypothetical protein